MVMAIANTASLKKTRRSSSMLLMVTECGVSAATGLRLQRGWQRRQLARERGECQLAPRGIGEPAGVRRPRAQPSLPYLDPHPAGGDRVPGDPPGRRRPPPEAH